MAKHVHSTSITLPHVTAPLSTIFRRRFLFTAANAAVLVGGIMANTVAGIADLVPTTLSIDPIQLGGKFVVLEKVSCAIYDGLKPIVDNKKARAA